MENLYTRLSQDMDTGLKEILRHFTSLTTPSVPGPTPATQSSERGKTGPKLASDPRRRTHAKIEMAVSLSVFIIKRHCSNRCISEIRQRTHLSPSWRKLLPYTYGYIHGKSDFFGWLEY